MSALAPATLPRPANDLRVLVVDAASGAMRIVASAALATEFAEGDLVVVNDAATLPASLPARTERGEEVELRLLGSVGETVWSAALLGAADHRTRTEDRPVPPPVGEGDRLVVDRDLYAVVLEVGRASPRLLTIELRGERPGAPVAEIWSALYRAGRPVQYAHVRDPLSLWDVQNVYAGRPWAVEMPSAGRGLRVRTLLELRRRGVEVAPVTHAAGISATGDPLIDTLLPLPERYEVVEATWEAIARTRGRGGRVIAVGTSVVRALEGGARAGMRSGVTELRIGPETSRAVVDAVLTGVHEPDTSHFELLGAFASAELLARAHERAFEDRMLGHELGDACLIWGAPRVSPSLGRGAGKPSRPVDAVHRSV